MTEAELFPQHLDFQLFPAERQGSDEDESPPSPCEQSLFPEEAAPAPSSRFRNRFGILADEELENPLDAAHWSKSREKIPAADKKWPGWPGDNVFRLVIPLHRVGAIIGRKGELVRKLCEESRAKIKILDEVQGATERIVLVTAKEEPEAKLSPAMQAFLKVHRRILDAGAETGETSSVTSRLLVHVAQAGSLIGRQGSTIKSIQDASHATVRVLSEESVPPFALEADRVVEVFGDLQKVHHAVQLVIGHLRRFLVDRSVLPLFDSNRLRSENEQASVLSGASSSPSSVMSQARVKQVLRLPLSCSEAIIGISGANISYMRRTSGASMVVQEIGNELCVEIEGTGQQVHHAQQLTENFVQQYENGV